MRKTKFLRITALMLALVFLLGGSIIGVSASDANAGGFTSAEEMAALLNATSYSNYLAEMEENDIPDATEEIPLNAWENYVYEGTGKVREYTGDEKYEGKDALYIPDTGVVSWKTDKIKTPARYSVVIDYFPVEGKPASIERTFMINGTVPFSEARYLTIPKVWKNTYADGSFALPEGENADSYVKKAEDLGIEARSEKRGDGTYIVYKMPDVWTKDISALTDEQALRFFTNDIDNNEIRGALEQAPRWSTYELKDANGFFQESFEFVLEPDEDGFVTLSMRSVNEPIAIHQIRLIPHEGYQSYKEYLEQYSDAPNGKDQIRIEAEYYSATSTQTIYPLEDRSSAATSPSATDRTVLSVLGGEKWQSAGQWVEYRFSVDSSGMYDIYTRFRQNILDGMFVSRALYLYSDDTLEEGDDGYYNGVPFAEANRLHYDFSSDWQSEPLNDGVLDAEGNKKGYKLYFEEGVVYTMRLEVTLGSMGEVVNTVQHSLDSINSDYLNILKLTGSSPDEYRDYGFARVMPDVMIDLILQGRTLQEISERLAEIAGDKSEATATLERIARLLNKMGTNEDEIAKNLAQLKTDIGSLGTWLGNAKTQPLQIDVISIQGEGVEPPRAEATFWQAFLYEIGSFIQSFFRNYDRMGTTEEISEDATEVWLAYGRDQSQVLRSLVNNEFTPNTQIPINLKLVAAGTLLPSVLSGMGPDVYIGLGQADVINYAIRGALLEIEDMEGFDETVSNFNEAAMIVLSIDDAEGVEHTYGVPETQSFSMMFVREDILAELGIDVPQTWDDVLEAIPTLQANNMEIGMHSDYKIFLYQKEGELFADDGMRINLDSNVALESFETMCNMFTMYSFPYKYDFANRFRTGEMPIGIADYTATYNQLKVFATEIEGAWSFYPVPGYIKANGEVHRESVSTVTALVMITGCENKEDAWEYMKWHSGAECQVAYSTEMVAIIGPSAKHPTANVEALASLPWNSAEFAQLDMQFNVYGLASIPNYPGSYIIDRYTKFAFLDALNEKADPVTELQSYITTINKEITRKREEFGLETLDYIGQTLAQKRMMQAINTLEELKSSSSYSGSYDGIYNRAIEVMNGGKTEDFATLEAVAAELRETNPDLFGKAADYMDSAVKSLIEYEKYK